MRKSKSHLVCQHMEMISRSALEDFQDVLKQFVRHRHGIYALYRKNKLCYVGLAKNLRSRLDRHLRDRHANSWDRFSVYLTINSQHLRELEALAIRIAAPKENRQKGKLRKSEDLKRVFRKTLNQSWKKRMREIFNPVDDIELDTPTLKEIIKGRKPALAGYFDKGTKLRFHYKGKLFRAYVKKNGAIRLNKNKKIYTSPSSAAFAIVKRGIDGWYAWRYERSPSEWVYLNELRK